MYAQFADIYTVQLRHDSK